MRWKIIAWNTGVVVLVGLLGYVILLTTLGDRLSDPAERRLAAEHATRSANAQLTLDGLTVERWLTRVVNTEPVRSVFLIGHPGARGDAATSQANRIIGEANQSKEFTGMQPTLVLFVDKNGVGLGRNNAALMRGDALGPIYPSLLESLASGRTQSAVWLNPERQEQLLASYAPVHGERGEVLGAVVVGTPVNDDRMDRTSRLTSGDALLLAIKNGDQVSVVAKTRNFPNALLEDVSAPLATIISGGAFSVIDEESHGRVLGAAPIVGYAGAQAALMAAVPVSLIDDIGMLLWPLWGVALGGVLLVVVGGFLLGAYISRPISQLEEGLLMIINGKTDMRFELEHAELGGLVSRVNSLLNALTGVPEGDDGSDES